MSRCRKYYGVEYVLLSSWTYGGLSSLNQNFCLLIIPCACSLDSRVKVADSRSGEGELNSELSWMSELLTLSLRLGLSTLWRNLREAAAVLAKRYLLAALHPKWCALTSLWCFHVILLLQCTDQCQMQVTEEIWKVTKYSDKVAKLAAWVWLPCHCLCCLDDLVCATVKPHSKVTSCVSLFFQNKAHCRIV